MGQNQTPLEEIQERVAESAPGLGVAVHLGAIDDWRRSMRSYRQRVAEDYAAQVKLIGGEATSVAEEPMGNLIVVGDIYGNDSDRIVNALAGGGVAPAAPASPPASTPTATASPAVPATETPTTQGPAGFTWPKAALLAAALIAGGGLAAGVPWLTGAYDKSESSNSTTINNLSDEQRLGIEVGPGGAEQ